MAEVFAATDTRLGRPVAVKLVGGHLLGDPATLRRFEREARAAAALSHPNVVSIFDLLEHEGRPALVMELVDGDSLSRRLERVGTLSVGAAVGVARGVAAGLGAAHRAGLVHRDVKPSNILLGPGDTPMLVDFGIARLHGSDATTSAEVLGSLPYLAPERARGDPGSAATDVYGLGCVLYEMLAGRSPYAGTDAAAVAAHAAPEVADVTAAGSTTPAWLAELVTRMLDPDPGGRPADGDAVLAALDAAGTADTRRLDTPLGAAAAATAALAPDGGGGGTRRAGSARWRPRAAVLLAVAIVGMGAGWWLGARDATRAAGGAAAPAASPSPSPAAPSEPSPSPSPSPSPTPSPPPVTFEQSVTRVRAAIAAGRDRGEVSAEAEDKLGEALSKILEERGKNNPNEDKLHDRVAALREELAKFYDSGAVTQARAAALGRLVDRLEETVVP